MKPKHKLKWSTSNDGTAKCTKCGCKVKHDRKGPRGGSVLVYRMPDDSRWSVEPPDCWVRTREITPPAVEIDPDTAYIPPFGTIRKCRGCGCLVAGGPTACARCAEAKG